VKTLFLFFLISLVVSLGQAQNIAQTVKGTITDQVTGSPLVKASLKFNNGSVEQVTQTDESGKFYIDLALGRYKTIVSYTGYAPVEQELLVIAGRQAIVTIQLSPSVQTLKEVEVSGGSLPTELPGLRSLSIEKTLRVPANFFDPVRVATAYPGVVAANDQGNSIIIRGNSPNGLLWRLNGLDIVNPNHLANAGTISDKPMANGGGVNILSAQMLGRTDFYMGAFPSNYGNALSGIIDMSMRHGNTDKREHTAQASLIGLDYATEGPIGKNKNTSYLVNLRYSTVGLLSKLGVNFGDESITFKDFSFNVNSNLKKGGQLSFFGFGGDSKNDFDAKQPDEWKEDKDKYSIHYSSKAYAVGLNYSTPLLNGKFFGGIAYSGNDQNRDQQVSDKIPTTEVRLLYDRYKLNNTILSTNLRFETSLSQKTIWEVGVMTNYMNNDLSLEKSVGCITCISNLRETLSSTNQGFLLQPFTNFKIDVNSSVLVNVGARYLQYTFNNSSSFEPRLSLTIRPTENSSVDVAYSLVSQLQLPQVYAANGNEDLGLTRSHHVDAGYRKTLSNGLNLRTGLFYQHLFNVPIEADPTSTFSTINLLESFVPGNLVNEGTGDNYGVDMTLEKMFYNRNYFLVGGSYYDSKYTAGDGVKRNTRFNGNYTFSAVYGKEWTKTEKNRTIGLNTRVLYLGGLRQSAVDVNNSQGNSETVYNVNNPFNEKLKDYFRIDLRLSFRKNKPGYTRTFAVDIQNLTSQQNEAYQYYDFTQQKIVSKYQLGIIPVLVYRIDF
jgi:hypothetical protein